MKLKNSLRILSDNFSNVYKFLLYGLIANILFFALSYAILNFGLHTLFTSAEVMNIFGLIGDFCEALVTGKTAYLETFQETFLDAVSSLSVLLGENVAAIVRSAVGVCLLYLFFRFLNGIALFAIASILHDKMTFYEKTSFSAAYFKNLGKGALYELLYVPLSFVYNALAIMLCWMFFFYVPSMFSSWGVVTVIFGLSMSVALYLVLQAVKMTVISAWIPAIVSGNGVFGGLRECFRELKHNFWGRFSNYLMAVYLIVILNIVCAVCTLGSFLLITIPASFIFLLCLQMVCYYGDNGIKFYLSRKDIFEAEEEDSEIIYQINQETSAEETAEDIRDETKG